MFDSPILEIAIGLVFVYLVLSIIATALNEGIANTLALRGKTLTLAIKLMLDDNQSALKNRMAKLIGFYKQRVFGDPKGEEKERQLFDQFMEHPITQQLMQGNKALPDSFDESEAGEVLTDILLGEGKIVKDHERLYDIIKQTAIEKGLFVEAKKTEGNITKPEAEIQRQIKPLRLALRYANEIDQTVISGVDKVVAFRKKSEVWFDRSAQQAGSWYRSDIRTISFIIGLIIAVSVNANTLAIIQRLSDDPEARQVVIAQAENYLESTQSSLVPAYDSTKAKSAWVQTSVTRQQLQMRSKPLKRELNRLTQKLAEAESSDSSAARPVNDSLPFWQKDTARLRGELAYLQSQVTALKGVDSAQRVARQIMENELDQLNTSLGLGWKGGAEWPVYTAVSSMDSCMQANPNISLAIPTQELPQACLCQDWGILKGKSRRISFWNSFFSPLIGWLITALAITLGAPFWFDLLKKLVAARKSGGGKQSENQTANA